MTSGAQPNNLPTIYAQLSSFGFEREEPNSSLVSSEIIFLRDMTSGEEGEVHIQTVCISWDFITKTVVLRTHVLAKRRYAPDQATWSHDYWGLTSAETQVFLEIMQKLEEAMKNA